MSDLEQLRQEVAELHEMIADMRQEAACDRCYEQAGHCMEGRPGIIGSCPHYPRMRAKREGGKRPVARNSNEE